MRPTLDYVTRKFDEYNALCFDGELPPIAIRLSNAGRSLGMFIHPRDDTRRAGAGVLRGAGGLRRGARDPRKCHIRISTRLDLPENEVEDTIIHEMIHYWIWLNAIPDDGVHGKAFRSKMQEINRRHNRHITVSHRSSETQLATDRHHRNNYICVQHWRDGKLTLTVCARTCIFDIHKVFSRHPQIERLEWFWSMETWFNRFPVSRTAKAYLVSPEDFELHFATATPCLCDGAQLRPLRRK